MGMPNGPPEVGLWPVAVLRKTLFKTVQRRACILGVLHTFGIQLASPRGAAKHPWRDTYVRVSLVGRLSSLAGALLEVKKHLEALLAANWSCSGVHSC
jgi:hypothetical protein